MKAFFIRYILTAVLAVSVVGLFLSCTPRSNSTAAGVNLNDNDDNNNSGDRSGTVNRGSLAGGGSCEGDSECEEMCDELFRSGKPTEECLELTVNEVEAMYEAFEEDDGLLKDPDEDDILDIHPDTVGSALDIKENIWTDFIKDYSQREASHVLQWIAEENEIFNAITGALDENDEEGLIEDLLKQLADDVTKAMVKEIGDDDEDVFISLAIDSGNEDVLDLAHDLLNENCLQDTAGTIYDDVIRSEHKEAACTLGEVYCKTTGGDYLFEDVFEEVLDVAGDLEDYIESGSSANEQGLAVDDKDSDDIEEVCRVFCGSDVFGSDPGQCT